MEKPIKESLWWPIWGEIWNIVKKYYPYPKSQNEWDELLQDANEQCEKYKGTEYETMVQEIVGAVVKQLDTQSRQH